MILAVSVYGTGCYTRFSWKNFYHYALSEDSAQLFRQLMWLAFSVTFSIYRSMTSPVGSRRRAIPFVGATTRRTGRRVPTFGELLAPGEPGTHPSPRARHPGEPVR
jgi:hypothetical protein